MKYYIKNGFFPFIYQLFMAMIAFGILMISGLIWLKIILACLNIGLYLFIVSAMAFKEGQDAFKVQTANDLERREIIRTGEDRPLKIHEEYKAWKGFAFGFVSCVPLLALLLVHTVIHLAGGDYMGLGAIAGVIYLMFFIFFRLNAYSSSAETAADISWYTYYGALVALPVVMLATGIAYILGAKKISRQQESIREKQRQIYGDRF